MKPSVRDSELLAYRFNRNYDPGRKGHHQKEKCQARKRDKEATWIQLGSHRESDGAGQYGHRQKASRGKGDAFEEW
jgi:hypothetical protein